MDELIERLSTGQHPISATTYKSAADLKQAIDNGHVLLKFTETKGGTELGGKLDKGRSVLGGADFEAGTGSVQLVTKLVLNYNEVELIADVDVGTRQGQGCLKLITDEPTWRAKQAQDSTRESKV